MSAESYNDSLTVRGKAVRLLCLVTWRVEAVLPNKCVDSGEAGSCASLDKLLYTSKIFLVMLTYI